jgi:hypothetical protein
VRELRLTTAIGGAGFGRSVIVAAIGALGVLPWIVLARPFAGPDAALAAYLVLLNAAYVALIAPRRGRRLAAFTVVGFAGAVVAVLSRSWSELALGLGLLLATARSGFLYRLPAARAVAIEIVLCGGGLLFARFLAAPSARGLMLALWGFLLVQSIYVLVGGLRVSLPGGSRRDPFVEAHARALELLEGG